MDVPGVVAAGLQRIDPQAVETGLLLQIEGAFIGEFRSVLGQQLREIRERRIPPRQIIERSIAGVTGIMMFARLALAGLIVHSQSSD